MEDGTSELCADCVCDWGSGWVQGVLARWRTWRCDRRGVRVAYKKPYKKVKLKFKTHEDTTRGQPVPSVLTPGAAPLTRAGQRLGRALITIAHIVPALYECRVLLREVRGRHVLVGDVERVLGPVAANSARGEHGLDGRPQRRGHLLRM